MTDAEGEADPLARYEPLVENYSAFRAACARPLPAVVRVNPIAAEIEQVVSAYEAAGIDLTPIGWHDGLFEVGTDSPGTTWPYVTGWVHGQEAVSTLPVMALDPDPTDRVLDLCAAPGSKTTQLAGRQRDRGTIVANDVDLGRLSALRSNCDRLGVSSVLVTNRDGRHFSASALAFDGFDHVLVDAPCSCEGTVRKNPDIFEDWSLDQIEGLAGTQRALLEQAVALTSPGGSVVYATCTFAPEENEAVVDHVLGERACSCVPIDLPITHSPGVTEWQGTQFDSAVRNGVRVYPHHNDTGGFFLARLEVPR